VSVPCCIVDRQSARVTDTERGLRGAGFDKMDWIELSQDRTHRRALILMALNLLGLILKS
jgi:hypothetical protein